MELVIAVYNSEDWFGEGRGSGIQFSFWAILSSSVHAVFSVLHLCDNALFEGRQSHLKIMQMLAN